MANCLRLLNQGAQTIFYSKSDLKSAFRQLPGKPDEFCLLTMKANHPVTGELAYFHDKCVAFRASISCALFQSFSDALQHITEYLLHKNFCCTNYLDDFLFYSESEELCNEMVRVFLALCERINCPVSIEKTKWAAKSITFLGILLEGVNKVLAVPVSKANKARNLLKWVIQKKKVTVLTIQRLMGTLNFLNKPIIPGRAFTRRMYSKLTMVNNAGKKLQQYHHVSLDAEFIKDCKMWLQFLDSSDIHDSRKLCRPFLDLKYTETSTTLQFYLDASGKIGMGVVYKNHYIVERWDNKFLRDKQPSIQFLELYTLVCAVLTWGSQLSNMRVKIYCDNKSVMDMCNSYSSSCEYCIKLIRILVIDNLKWNRRVFVKYIKSASNVLADAFSRQNFQEFWDHAPETMLKNPDKIPSDIWLPSQFF